jgi:hypothetical protein
MLIILFSSTRTAYNDNFYKFQTFTPPSSLPVAKMQYLVEAPAHVSSKCDYLISRTI